MSSLIAYRDIGMGPERRELVDRVNEIVAEYDAKGYQLNLRQIYYQFVSRNWLANKDTEYKRLGDIIADGRYAGLISWEAVEDRTRNLKSLSHWADPKKIIDSCVRSYRTDKWADQPYRPELWVEKEALAGIVSQTAEALDVSYLACRGYMSASEMWAASQRFGEYCYAGQIPVVLHLGDHDPSGIDMSRDIQDRLNEFLTQHGHPVVKFERLALNMAQVDEYNPPPNPAKLSDSRCTGYVDRFGSESWELDALDPTVLDELMRDAVLSYRDDELWDAAVAAEDDERKSLRLVLDNWQATGDYLRELTGGAS